jgi:tetratricopeptide (TPR) repeat protein
LNTRALPTIPAVHAAALAAHQAGRLDEAARGYREVLRFKPNHADALNNLGLVEWDRGERASAEALCAAAVAAFEHPRYLQNLGAIRAERGDDTGARSAFGRGLEIAPEDAELLKSLLSLLIKSQDFEQAEICNDRLLRLSPDDPKTLSDLGGFAHIRDHFARAESLYKRALEIDPLNADACLNLSSLGLDTLRFEMAEAYARRALEGAPESPRARLALSHALLSRGRWTEAWPGYDLRALTPDPGSDFPIPRWRGEPLTGKRIAVICEQGLGDSLQFGRYVALLKARGVARVTLVGAPALHRLMAHMDGVDDVADRMSAADPFDVWSPTMSLPRYFGTTLENLAATLPQGLPYIRVGGPGRRPSAADAAPLKVGLFWAGGHHDMAVVSSRVDSQRSLTTDQALGLLLDPAWAGRVRWTLLQKDRRPDYLTALAHTAGWRDPFGDRDRAAGADLLDTAEIIAGLDLVIGVDSALIHLSGALGRPTWMMDRWSHCWRWRPGATTSDWYPGVFRIFRQSRFGDWAPVVDAVRDALSALASPPSMTSAATSPPAKNLS